MKVLFKISRCIVSSEVSVNMKKLTLIDTLEIFGKIAYIRCFNWSWEVLNACVSLLLVPFACLIERVPSFLTTRDLFVSRVRSWWEPFAFATLRISTWPRPLIRIGPIRPGSAGFRWVIEADSSSHNIAIALELYFFESFVKDMQYRTGHRSSAGTECC